MEKGMDAQAGHGKGHGCPLELAGTSHVPCGSRVDTVPREATHVRI